MLSLYRQPPIWKSIDQRQLRPPPPHPPRDKMSAPQPPRVTASPPSGSATPQRPEPTALQTPASPRDAESNATLRPEAAGPQTIPKKKRNNHRGGRKKRARRQSFAVSNDGAGMPETSSSRREGENTARASFYRLQGRNMSNTSIESDALLDHR